MSAAVLAHPLKLLYSSVSQSERFLLANSWSWCVLFCILGSNIVAEAYCVLCSEIYTCCSMAVHSPSYLKQKSVL
jgi:hypothetical protein